MGFFSAAEVARLQETTVRMAFLARLDFSPDPVYCWNGTTELVAGDGLTYQPLHGTGRIDNLNFARTSQSDRFEISLDGIPDSATDVLSVALSETAEVEDRLATILLQFFDDDWQTVGQPVTTAWGFMRKPRVTRANGVQRVVVGCENIFFNRARPPAGRYTDRDQQARFDGDLICQFIPKLRNTTFTYPDF